MPAKSNLLEVLAPSLIVACAATMAEAQTIEFNRDVRSILSNHCFKCHGPDVEERQGGIDDGLRLDTPEGSLQDLGGYAAVVPGDPDGSELIKRVTSDDPDQAMPPAESGRRLTEKEIGVLRRWIAEGATFARHWSYAPPQAKTPPAVQNTSWPTNEIDRFILARLESEGLTPSQEADRAAIIRRVALDLTGLPPTIEEVDAFLSDDQPDAYGRMVDRMLAKESFGENWARMWLDLARYADSAGYADDPPRTIWAYRDYVIRAFNTNRPFDVFTIEQIAGDLLPSPTDEQLIATAFHRNTLTNNEGGTNDEEFRNVAIVDRVNTTMAVWMGTTINCAQCHNHKFDPISQKEFFGLFAVLNNTQDADRRDESPLLEVYTDEQKEQRRNWETEVAEVQQVLSTSTPELIAAQHKWEAMLAEEPAWSFLQPTTLSADHGIELRVTEDQSIRASGPSETNRYTLDFAVAAESTLTALRLETLPDSELPGGGAGFGGGNFVVTKISATVNPPTGTRTEGRFVRIELPGTGKLLSLAEVEVLSGADNVATTGTATQSSTDFDGPPQLAIDGNTNGDYNAAKSTTHTAQSNDPWWEVDLGGSVPIDAIRVWNRTDNNLQSRLAGYRLFVLDADRNTVWQQEENPAPDKNAEFSISGVRPVTIARALADYAQAGFPGASALSGNAKTGWAVGGGIDQPHQLSLIPSEPLQLAAGSTLSLVIEQQSEHKQHTLGKFRLSSTSDPDVASFAEIPADVLAILKTDPPQRSEEQQSQLSNYYLTIAPSLASQRERLATVQKQLANLKPETTVPIQRELAPDQHRTTRLQFRGNFLDTGDEVSPGVPSAFHELADADGVDRMDLAKWLVARENPLTARVVVNRFWEKLFGRGLVVTSEEFGTQGEPPSHPALLDWLAVEFMESGWNMKASIRQIVMSSTYRQSSRVTPELLERDPGNRLLARGPRVRLSAETIRDQALFVSGLLSPKMYGPPVRPPQPSLGVNAAFGSGIDWETSKGEDRYRRGLYTTWRRSNPYPSMVAFDAPNREVCTLRRDPTNTPLQAFVTLNDPVFVEAAQSLARRIADHDGTPAEQAEYGFRLCLARHPSDAERSRIIALYDEAKTAFAADAEQAKMMATDPLGPAPEGADVAELAAWTVVGNVLLNLDETLMKR